MSQKDLIQEVQTHPFSLFTYFSGRSFQLLPCKYDFLLTVVAMLDVWPGDQLKTFNSSNLASQTASAAESAANAAKLAEEMW